MQAEVSSAEEVRDPATRPETLRLLHELQVHQVELEMQNEELRRSHAEMDALQERYRNLYDKAPVGYCTLSVQGIVMEANLTAAALLGVPRAALVGRHFSSFVPSDDQDMYFLKRQLIVQSGEPLDWEQRLRRKDGTVIWVSIKTTGLGTDQDWSQYRLVFSDITEGKRTEDTLRTLSTAMEQSPVSIVITNLAGAIEYVNPKFTEMTGYTAEEAMGQNPRILKSDEAAPGYYRELLDTILGGGTWHGEFHNRRKGGELFWEQATISPIKDTWGRITHFVAIKEDITERKQWDASLRASEAKWRTLFEFLPVGISLLDDQRRVAEFNPALGSILRLAPDRLQGASYLDRTYLQADGTVMPAEGLPSVRAMKEGGAIPPIEIGIQIEDGSLIWTEVAAAPLDVPGYSCVITTTDITQRKQTQEGLQRSEEALAKAQRFARVGSWTWHIKTNLLDWSDEMYRLFGLARETFSGDLAEVVTRAIHPEDREAVEASNRSVAELGRPVPLEYRIILPDGTTRVVWGEAGEMVLDAEGRPESLSGIVQDITERRAADQALRDSEARFVSMAQNSPVAFYRFSRRWGGIYYSPRIQDLLGYTPEELLAEPMRWYNSIQPEDIPMVESALAAAQTRLDSFDLVYRIRHKAGHERWFKDTGTCRLEPDGDLIIDGVVLDITDRRRAQVALQESNELLSHFISQSPVFAYIKEVAPGCSRVVQASNNFVQMLGIAGPDMIGKTMDQLFPAEMAAKMTADDWAVVTSGKGLELEESFADRSYYTLKFPIVQQDKTLLAGFSIDITEREQSKQIIADSYQQLRLLLAKLQRAQEDERIRVSREVHDDLGQLLTELKLELGWLERRLSEEDLPPSFAPLLDKVMGTSELADTITKSVQRIAADLRPNTLESLGLEAALEQETRRFQERTGLPCALAVAPDWPVLGAGLAVELFYICREALTNVTRHAQASRVYIRLHCDGAAAVLVVADDGRGITAAEVEAPSALGLLGMRERANRFGGTITFEPDQPRGTRVIVRVPLPTSTNPEGVDR